MKTLPADPIDDVKSSAEDTLVWGDDAPEAELAEQQRSSAQPHTDSWTVLIVDDDEAESAEAGSIRKQGMRADDDINGARRSAGAHFRFLFSRTITAEKFDRNRPAGEALLKAFEMLLREHRGRRENRDLSATENGFEGRS